ncbi:tetratricopeptide repeat protein [Nocardia sp. XZ_19_231]|uniref:tetratricopeptide repeat protein n=1 Tax=Nocardia sp. XZ_19_231 TaxID=2769252 RepID=UPI0018901F1B|nr:tetratricopeptide repeat protein [Nocardia sp. XZ_19_231]
MNSLHDSSGPDLDRVAQMRALIERSSLGEEGARRLAQRASKEQVDRIGQRLRSAGLPDCSGAPEAPPSPPATPAPRTLGRAVDVLELPTVPRILIPGDREKTSVLVTRMRELLSTYPVGRFGASGSALVLNAVAAMSEALIEDRDARSALLLMQAASPHLQVLGRHDQRGFRVRRTWAAARSELGQYRTAERLLRRLRDDEQRVMNFAEPWTEIHLQWTFVRRGDVSQAAEGFQTLSTGLAARADHIDIATLGHLECRWNWVRGQQGLVEESAKGYRRVIEGRSAVLGPDDPATLDARQSLGAMFELNGQLAQAISISESLLEDRKRVLGPTHVDTLETTKSLYLARFRAEPRSDHALDQIVEELRYIRGAQAESHGPGHPATFDTGAQIHEVQTPPDEARSTPLETEQGRVPVSPVGA